MNMMQQENQIKFSQEQLDMESPAVRAAMKIRSAMGLNEENKTSQVSQIIIIARRLRRNEEPKSLACYIVEKFCRTPSDDILRQVTAILRLNEPLFKDLGMTPH